MNWCVMILAVGSPFYKSDSLDVLRHYFKKHNIQYHIIENAPPSINFRESHPSWWKLLAHKILPDYEFIICWDLDLLPRNMEVNVISDFDMTKLCMAWDSHAKHKPTERFTQNFKYNGGLIGIPKILSSFTESVFYKYAPGIMPSYEQYYLNDEIQIQGIEIYELPSDINVLHSFEEFGNARLQHYTYTGVSKSLIKNHKNKYFNNPLEYNLPKFNYKNLFRNLNRK